MWKKKLIEQTQLLLMNHLDVPQTKQPIRERINSFKSKTPSSKEEGAIRVIFFFQKCMQRLLRYGLDQILETSRQEDLNKIHHQTKQMVKSSKNNDRQQSRLRTSIRDFIRIPLILPPQLNKQETKEDNNSHKQYNQTVLGKSIISKLQKLQHLVNETKEEINFKGRMQRYYSLNHSLHPSQIREKYVQSGDIMNNQYKDLKTHEDADIDFQIYQSQRQNPPKKTKRRVQGRPQSKIMSISNQEHIMSQLRQIKSEIRELFQINRQMMRSLQMSRISQDIQFSHIINTNENSRCKVVSKQEGMFRDSYLEISEAKRTEPRNGKGVGVVNVYGKSRCECCEDANKI